METNNTDNINKICLEKILSHLTKLICITEFENIKDLGKLVDMATSVSAQLNASSEFICSFSMEDDEDNEEDCEENIEEDCED